MRTVLIIAYDYPPRGWSGTQRTVKFCKYLPEFGWRPVVLAPSRWYLPAPMDPSLLAEVSQVTAARTGMITHDDFIELFGDVGVLLAPVLALLGKGPRWLAGGLRWRYQRWLCPDYACGWIPAALSRGLQLVRRHRPDVIYATAPPSSGLVIGALLSMLTRRPFVADFRDLWVKIFDRRDVAAYRDWADPKLERMVVRRASRVICTAEASARTLAESHASEPTEKFRTIYNGYDPEDFPAPGDAAPPEDRLTICHVGSLYGKRTPAPFLAGLAALLGERPALREQVRVRFVGQVDEFADLFAGFAHRRVLEMTGPVPHERATRYLLQSHASLLLMERGAEAVIPGKIFEYLVADRPILAMAPLGGDAAAMLARAGGATVLDVEDSDGAKRALADLHAAWRNGAPAAERDRDYVRQFERRRLTRRLAGVLAEAAKGGTRA